MKNIKFKIIEFLYDKKLFGMHKKCWADLVAYCLAAGEWNNVRDATKCGYCTACMTYEEIEEMLERD